LSPICHQTVTVFDLYKRFNCLSLCIFVCLEIAFSHNDAVVPKKILNSYNIGSILK
jgi:hypothetical protein